jgi:predicted transcriptional regulator of viral defense system
MSQRDPPVFELSDAQRLLGASTQVTSNLLSRLAKQGWIVRVRRGVYEVAPIWAEPGSYGVDRFTALAHSLDPPYYVGFRSALELYGWLQHPVIGRLWVAVPSQRRSLRTPRDRVVWVVTSTRRFDWGLRDHWIGTVRFRVSDPERTLLDCLHLPRHAGGIVEVAGSLARAWPTLDHQRLNSHAVRMDIASVTRRLGALLDALAVDGEGVLESQPPKRWRGRPVSLDPNLPAIGEVNRRWGVRMNIPASELFMVGRT